MSAINDGGPAFPCDEIYDQTPPYRHLHAEQGMSLRDYFAAKAMQGYVSRSNWMPSDRKLLAELGFDGLIARYSYDTADAMIKERSNER